MSIDLTIIAIVFTIILLLVFFSAVILYLSFRIKETFKKTNRTAKIVQTAFLIGILFLAGAILYYSAATLTNQNQPSPTPTPNPTAQPTPTNPANTPTTPAQPTPTNNPNQPTPTSTPQPTPTQTPTPGQPITFSAFYPASTTLDSQITLTFTAINPTTFTYKNAVIQTGTLLQTFIVLSSTNSINANIINIGDLPPGTTTITLNLQAPNHPSTYTDNATLIYQGIQNPPTQQITITIRGR